MLDWNGDTRLVVDGTHFWVNPLEAGREQLGDALVLNKPRWLVERYASLRSELEVRNLFELGIYEGGSTALLSLLFRPQRMVAIDLTSERAPALDAFVETRALTDVVHAHFGVDQADRTRLETIVADEFGAEPLDLVIDDASHLLAETIASFNVLYPRLRPGGLFVLEDWSWDHHVEAVLDEALRSTPDARERLSRLIDDGDAAAPTGAPMSRFVLQLVLTAAYAEDVVAEITNLRHGWVAVKRGDAALDPETFDISQCYGSIGRALLQD